MKIIKDSFGGKVFVFEYIRASDNRGDFSKVWMEKWIGGFSAAEAFLSTSKKGVIRGLHYSLSPMAQKKIVCCIAGRIMDVIVDIRKNSPTYGRHVSVELQGKGKEAVFVGEGFAHGFLALEDSTVLYLMDKPYDAKFDRGIRWDDPEIGIQWKIAKPVLSEKDSKRPGLAEAENNFYYK